MAKITYEEKMQTKKRIEEAAKEVFKEKGVLKASIREVAKRAGVGASTIYGYYSSKPRLFIETILPSIESRKSMSDTLENVDLKTATFDEIVEKISEAIFVLPRSIHNFDREIVREIHMVMFSQAKGRKDIQNRMMDFMNEEIITIVEAFYKRMKDEDLFIVDINPSELAELTIGIVRLIFFEYIIIIAVSEEDAFDRLKSFVRLMLIGKF